MGRENRLSAVAVLPQGLEAAGCDELSKLGAHDVRPLRRAAEFQADMACLYRLHLQARLPFRILRETVAPHVEMTCLQGLADLERLEGPWLDCMGAGEPENAAMVMRLMLAHMVVLNKRVMSAMVLDRLDAEVSLSTPLSTPDRCQRFVNGANSVNGTDC